MVVVDVVGVFLGIYYGDSGLLKLTPKWEAGEL